MFFFKPKMRKSYEANFKLKVVSYAEEFGNRSAEREYGVSEKVVRDWRKKKDDLNDMPDLEHHLFMTSK